MALVKPEFDLRSLVNELSRFDCGSTSEQRIQNGLMVVQRRMEHERESPRRNLEIVSSGKKPLQDSRTSGDDETQIMKKKKKSLVIGSSRGKGKKAVMCTREFKEVSERLRILEEETESMKQELFEVAEERKRLMDAVYQQFQTLEIDPTKFKSSLQITQGH